MLDDDDKNRPIEGLLALHAHRAPDEGGISQHPAEDDRSMNEQVFRQVASTPAASGRESAVRIFAPTMAMVS